MAIIIGLPTLLGFVAWLIHILSDPVRWCSVTVSDGKIATSTIKDCTDIVLELIKWLGYSCMALIVCIIIAFLTIVGRDLKATIGAHGFGGGVELGGDPAIDAANKVAGAAKGAADEIKDETA